MIHSKLRLTITLPEASLLKPGLDALNTGLATAAHGDFPDFYAEVLGHYGRDIHPNRRFDLEMAGKIPRLHEQLATNTSSRKVRLDLFEIATAQFALRLLKSSFGPPPDPSTVQALDRKLEKYRKRAKRKTETTHGKAAVLQASETWREFVSWCRFNLLYFRIPARTFALPRKGLWTQQRSSMAGMISLALEERFYAPLDEAQVKRMVRLIKEEFHRGRHPVILRELLAGDQTAGRQLLFRLVAKKMELTPLPGAELPVSIEASERGEHFEAAARARRVNRVTASDSVRNVASLPAESPIEQNANLEQEPNPSNRKAKSPLSAPEAGLSMAIADWLKEHVAPNLWQTVTGEVQFALQHGLDWAKPVQGYSGMADLIRKSRPEERSYDPTAVLIDIVLPADWLFTWATKMQPDPGKAYTAVLQGYGNALKAV